MSGTTTSNNTNGNKNSKEINEIIKIIKLMICAFVIAVVGFTACILTSCAQIDFSKKAIAFEETLWGMDISVPSIVGEATSMLSLKIGYLTVKYTSAPAGASVSIDKQYSNISFWNLSGDVKTIIKVNNGTSETFPSDAPVKK